MWFESYNLIILTFNLLNCVKFDLEEHLVWPASAAHTWCHQYVHSGSLQFFCPITCWLFFLTFPLQAEKLSHSHLYRLKTYLKKHLVLPSPTHSHILLSTGKKQSLSLLRVFLFIFLLFGNFTPSFCLWPCTYYWWILVEGYSPVWHSLICGEY